MGPAAAPWSAVEVAPLVDVAGATLAGLLAALAAVVPPEVEAAAGGPVDPEALRAAIDRIERLLEQDDVEAVGALEQAAALREAAAGQSGARA